jgi:hypothetical protein
MKKLLPVLAIFLGVMFVSHARADGDGTAGFIGREKVWRDSSTASTDLNVCIATTPIKMVLKKIVVNNPGTSSYIEIFDGSISSQTAVRKFRLDTTSHKSPEYMMGLSSGLIYNNIGSPPADVTQIWDWDSSDAASPR